MQQMFSFAILLLLFYWWAQFFYCIIAHLCLHRFVCSVAMTYVSRTKWRMLSIELALLFTVHSRTRSSFGVVEEDRKNFSSPLAIWQAFTFCQLQFVRNRKRDFVGVVCGDDSSNGHDHNDSDDGDDNDQRSLWSLAKNQVFNSLIRIACDMASMLAECVCICDCFCLSLSLRVCDHTKSSNANFNRIHVSLNLQVFSLFGQRTRSVLFAKVRKREDRRASKVETETTNHLEWVVCVVEATNHRIGYSEIKYDEHARSLSFINYRRRRRRLCQV